MVKLLLAMLLVSSSLFALSPSQVSLVKQAYTLGAPYNLGNTLAGIVYVESTAGLYKVNPTTNDYGCTGINIYSFLARIKVEPTYYNRSFYATQLVIDDEYALKAALLELLYWQLDRKRTDWAHLVSSYNRGTNVDDYSYARKVAHAIKFLKSKGLLHD